MIKKFEASIIIVHYRNEVDLIACLDSLYRHIPKNFEVIIVDNSEEKRIEDKLKTKYKNLAYIPSSENIGFGAGVNMGAKFARGDYLFVLNPDVIFKQDILNRLLLKIKRDKKIGIIAPLLYDIDSKIMDQGARELTPLVAIFQLSFLKKIWPNNPFARNYWVKNWRSKGLKMVDNVPGSAFLVKKDLFNKIGGFDENFFLYFEEFDLCNRVRRLRYKICIDPSSKLLHKWGTTTKLLADKDEIFEKSRFYYFKKHFGIAKALIVETTLRLRLRIVALLAISACALLLRIYNIGEFVPFYGDIGWFYVSARELILTHNVPLVGIASSHPWLHQGPVWTYVLAIILYVYNFNPVAPFYFTAILDVFTLLFLYKLASKFFSTKMALFACLLYAFSPAVVLSARTAYHTSLIPFFSVLFLYGLYKWTTGKPKYFIFSVFSVAILYNLELQASIFGLILLLTIAYGHYKKSSWHINTLKPKVVAGALIAFLLPMYPVLLYDVKNGFPQTIIFLGWIGYKFATFLFNSQGSLELDKTFVYLSFFFQKLIFIQNSLLAICIVSASLLFLIYQGLRKRHAILVATVALVFASVLFNKTPSDAYTMSLFIPIILSVSLFLSFLSKNRLVTLVTAFILVVMGIINTTQLISNNYFVGFSKGYGPGLKERISVSKYMIDKSGKNTFTVLGKGEGSEFDSFTMNYQYLTWYLGKEFKKGKGAAIYLIEENPKEIQITKKE